MSDFEKGVDSDFFDSHESRFGETTAAIGFTQLEHLMRDGEIKNLKNHPDIEKFMRVAANAREADIISWANARGQGNKELIDKSVTLARKIQETSLAYFGGTAKKPLVN